MGEYTPTTLLVRSSYAVCRAAENDRPEARAEFDRWLAAHDAVIREDERKLQAERDIAIVGQLYAPGSQAIVGNVRTVIAVALRSQSFTGTESETNV